MAIDKLTPIKVPDQYVYIYHHFWTIYDYCGKDFTLTDLREYCMMFAPFMSNPDKAVIIKLRNAASNYIFELENGAG